MHLQSIGRRSALGAGIAVCATLAVVGCSGTKLNNMWRDPAHAGPAMTNVLVVGMRQSATTRRLWEDAFVKGFTDKGVKATPSYTLFPNALPDTNQVADRVDERRYDGVLIVSRLSPSISTKYVPGYTTSQPVTYYSRWRGYYVTRYREIYTPGYTEVDNVSRHEVTLWTTGDDARMVWTGTTSTINPEDGDQVREEVTSAVLPQLDELHLLNAD